MARLESHVRWRTRSLCSTQFHLIDGSDHRNHKEQVLRFSLKFKTAAASAVAAVALMAVGVSGASAVPAVWNSPGQATVSGSLTINWGSFSTVCPLNSTYTYQANGTAPVQARLSGGFGGGGQMVHVCANSNWLAFGYQNATGEKSGSVFSLSAAATGNGTWDPFSSPGDPYFYTKTPYTVSFVNGTASIPSKIVYNNTQFGTSWHGGALRATGTLTITKADGSLLKLL